MDSNFIDFVQIEESEFFQIFEDSLPDLTETEITDWRFVDENKEEIYYNQAQDITSEIIL
jgi:hypothetical protein